MINYQEEYLSDIRDEVLPLIEEHYSAVYHFAEEVPLDIDWSVYFKLEDAGMLNVVTARDEGKLIGYYISFIAPNLHSMQSTRATNDAVYLDPAYRKTGLGVELISYAEDVYKRLGVDVMEFAMKNNLPFEGTATKVGMIKTEQVYAKYIGE
jgi:GNAT superfamily N-acetyltransferase